MLVATQTNHHIVRVINCRLKQIKNQQTGTNAALQREDDDIFLNQQQSKLWTSSITSQVIDQMAGNNSDTVITPAPIPAPVPTPTPTPTLIGTTPVMGTAPTKTNEETLPKLSQPMKELELWHQRMEHCSTRANNETQKCTDGIPPLPTNTPFFKCPFCEKAKMLKNSGNKSKDEDVFIPGQAYHMDLAFVSGPSKLNDICTNSVETVTIKQSRDRYIGFLTIINVASRQL